jgi:Flp pilus assembly protein TadG
VWTLAWGPAFLVLLVLVTDIAHVWLARVELENAVESGALAGAKVWGDSPDSAGTRTAAHTAAKNFVETNTVVGTLITVSANNNPAATNDNAACPGSVLLGNINGTTFEANVVPASANERGCRVEASATVNSLWTGYAGPFTVRASATARYDGTEGSGTPRLVRITSLLCM